MTRIKRLFWIRQNVSEAVTIMKALRILFIFETLLILARSQNKRLSVQPPWEVLEDQQNIPIGNITSSNITLKYSIENRNETYSIRNLFLWMEFDTEIVDIKNVSVSNNETSKGIKFEVSGNEVILLQRVATQQEGYFTINVELIVRKNSDTNTYLKSLFINGHLLQGYLSNLPKHVSYHDPVQCDQLISSVERLNMKSSVLLLEFSSSYEVELYGLSLTLVFPVVMDSVQIESFSSVKENSRTWSLKNWGYKLSAEEHLSFNITLTAADEGMQDLHPLLIILNQRILCGVLNEYSIQSSCEAAGDTKFERRISNSILMDVAVSSLFFLILLVIGFFTLVYFLLKKWNLILYKKESHELQAIPQTQTGQNPPNAFGQFEQNENQDGGIYF